MTILFSLICFLITSEIVASHKPPLPIINNGLLPIKQLDTSLRARSFTLVDQLNEDLEDRVLTQKEKTKLQELNDKQDEIVLKYKTSYRELIKQYIEEETFDKSEIIDRAILDYRTMVQQIINTELEAEIKTFRDDLAISLKMQQAQKPTFTDSRRRQREDD